MPTEVEQHTYDHIGDAETVFITHPDTEGVGQCNGLSFKVLWAPKGWTQTTREAYEAHLEALREQVSAFVASSDADVAPVDGDAQDIIMTERTGEPAKRHRGGATSEGGNV